MGNLTESLTTIYNTKLAIKEAIGTQSDVFTEYPSYITALKPSGTSYITTNGEHNVSSYAYAYVTVSGGSGSSEDPRYDALTMAEVIEQGLTSAKYVRIPIDDDFDFRGLQNAPYAMWKANIRYYDENLDDNVDALVIVSILSDNYNILYDEGLRLNSAFTSYPELYGAVQPVLEDVTVKFVQKPSVDYYAVTGGIHYLNTPITAADVHTITENGVYPTTEGIGVEIVVPSSGITPSGTITIDDNEIGNTVDVTSYAYAYIDIQGGGGITPSGTSYISTNGTHDVSSYAYAYVNVPNNGVVLSGGEYWHVSPIDSDTSINISQSANSYINIVSFTEFNVESEDGMSPGNNFTALTVKDTNGTILEESYRTTAFNEGESVTLTLQSATTICLYKYYWVWNTEPGDPEMGVSDSYYLDVSSSEPISAGTNNGYILENLPAGTYTIIVKWGYQGNNDIVILNHINVSDQCVASSNQYIEF